MRIPYAPLPTSRRGRAVLFVAGLVLVTADWIARHRERVYTRVAEGIALGSWAGVLWLAWVVL